MLFFRHVGKTSSIPSPTDGLSAAIAAVARRRKEYHVVAAVEGHELKTPETELRPGLERLLETTHLELDGKLFVNTQQAPTWGANCRRFDPGGVPGPTSKLSPRAPAQMGRREMEREGGKTRGRQA
jgi:signal transduction histidine kinase